MKKSVCLVCNYRVGSTNTVKAGRPGMTNGWELFGDVRKILPTKDNILLNDLKHVPALLDRIRKRPTFFKLMGDQILWDPAIMDQIAEVCDIEYLYRRNFAAQAYSWTAWLKSPANSHGHHYGETKTYQIEATQDFFDDQTDVLVANYKFLIDTYKRYPGPIKALEDFPTHKPYNREYKWVNKPVLNVPFDTTILDTLGQDHDRTLQVNEAAR